METKKEQTPREGREEGKFGVGPHLHMHLHLHLQVGLAYFDTVEDATTALVLVNHKEVEVGQAVPSVKTKFPVIVPVLR